MSAIACCVFLGVSSFNPVVQILGILPLISLFCILTLAIRPYQANSVNVFEGATYLIIAIMSTLMLVYSGEIKDYNEENQRAVEIAFYCFISLLAVLFVFGILRTVSIQSKVSNQVTQRPQMLAYDNEVLISEP